MWLYSYVSLQLQNLEVLSSIELPKDSTFWTTNSQNGVSDTIKRQTRNESLHFINIFSFYSTTNKSKTFLPLQITCWIWKSGGAPWFQSSSCRELRETQCQRRPRGISSTPVWMGGRRHTFSSIHFLAWSPTRRTTLPSVQFPRKKATASRSRNQLYTHARVWLYHEIAVPQARTPWKKSTTQWRIADIRLTFLRMTTSDFGFFSCQLCNTLCPVWQSLKQYDAIVDDVFDDKMNS